uniref:Uncharacterized protein n=1 Tax=Rhizophora mucronata TaxID=61149 RepID=A0A2P2Q772_RHIMU
MECVISQTHGQSTASFPVLQLEPKKLVQSRYVNGHCSPHHLFYLQ